MTDNELPDLTQSSENFQKAIESAFGQSQRQATISDIAGLYVVITSLIDALVHAAGALSADDTTTAAERQKLLQASLKGAVDKIGNNLKTISDRLDEARK